MQLPLRLTRMIFRSRARWLALALLALPAHAQTNNDAFWLGMGVVNQQSGGESDPLLQLFGFSSQSIVGPLTLTDFSGGPGGGMVREGSSWEGNVVQHADHITVNAGNENGWHSPTSPGDLTGMRFVSITAQRHAGNTAGRLALQLDLGDLTDTYVVSFDTSWFSYDAPTQVYVALNDIPDSFDMSQVGSWSLGGGGLGTEAFHMSLYNVQLTAIPEPSEYAAMLGLAVLGARLYRRRKCQSR